MAKYIELEAAIRAFQTNGSTFVYNLRTCNAIISRLKLVTAADVRPVVRAEFVRCGDGKSVPYMCTHCGKTVPANLVEIWGANFCPNCGADMQRRVSDG